MNEWEWQLLEETTPAESVRVGGSDLRVGSRVVLHPGKRGDIFDLALAGQTAVIESIEQDYEGNLHLAVVLEEDPGKDLGVMRQPGHRFFFKPEEVEPAAPVDGPGVMGLDRLRVLVAGIGNIFLGDDGFGVEVARRLMASELPDRINVRDFGIRGYDLAYALLDHYDLKILVDACPRGQTPGTVYLIEPEIGDESEAQTPAMLDAHTMNPLNVLRYAKSMGPLSGRILLVGCEPETLGGEDGQMGLSGLVSTAVDSAVGVVQKLIADAGATKERSSRAYGT